LRENALVLLSGGLDSSVALYWALKRGFGVRTITFNYFLRSSKEITACRTMARRAGVKNTVINLEFLKEIVDLRKQARNPLLKKAPSAYIPSRNTIFYGIASSIAETMDAKYIIGGHNKDDAHTFPDASLDFFKLFNKTASLGKLSNGRTGNVIMPLSNLNKSQVVKLGRKLGVPFELTWSCYFSGRRPCGKCPACKLRETAFREAHIDDPLRAAA
jgi:7-cyano-7-deazaguanine synthase